MYLYIFILYVYICILKFLSRFWNNVGDISNYYIKYFLGFSCIDNYII